MMGKCKADKMTIEDLIRELTTIRELHGNMPLFILGQMSEGSKLELCVNNNHSRLEVRFIYD